MLTGLFLTGLENLLTTNHARPPLLRSGEAGRQIDTDTNRFMAPHPDKSRFQPRKMAPAAPSRGKIPGFRFRLCSAPW